MSNAIILHVVHSLSYYPYSFLYHIHHPYSTKCNTLITSVADVDDVISFLRVQDRSQEISLIHGDAEHGLLIVGYHFLKATIQVKLDFRVPGMGQLGENSAMFISRGYSEGTSFMAASNLSYENLSIDGR